MEFKQFKKIQQDHFQSITQDADCLLEVAVDKDEIWNLYLDSFDKKYNKVFRERPEKECNCCRQFIRAIANVVVIKDNQVHTIWDFQTDSEEYQPSVDALAVYVRSKAIEGYYVTREKSVGTSSNLEKREGSPIIEWDHFYLDIPSKFVDTSSETEGTVNSNLVAIRNVFKRSLDELTEDSVTTVLELISSNSLYKGEEWKSQLELFLSHQKAYKNLSDEEKENYAWEQAFKVGGIIGKIRNHSIGQLLINISEDKMDLDTAVKRYEKIIAPENYKRPNEIFTKKMLEAAKKQISDLGYMDSLTRRYAVVDDITVNNILFLNRDTASKIAPIDVFEEMSKDVAIDPRKFSKVEEISVDKFLKDVLPLAKEVEVLLENKHAANMMSLIAPQNKDANTMFKWGNNFSWAYAGNMTDSPLREKVQLAGGRVDGALRFSHTWNYDGQNQSLMDLHVFMPGSGVIASSKKEEHDNYPPNEKQRVGWNRRMDYASGGVQDVDFVNPPMKNVPVENITFPDVEKMPEGTYVFKIHNWKLRQPTRSGFKAEIEFGGNIYSFEYDKPMGNKEWITLAEVTLKDGEFTMNEILPSSTSVKEIWNLSTNQFVPVSMVMRSPNYWDDQSGIGHEHVFFMINDCISDESPNAFYNEFLKQDLLKHKRVFAALGSKMKVESSEDQLSGLGFSRTKKESVVVRVKGNTDRVMKVRL